MSSSIWDSFTKKYSLSKTLRFELKPVGNTKQMLLDNEVFEKDKLIQEKYVKTKPYFDRLHRKFIGEALKEFSFLSLDKYQELSDLLKKEKNKIIEKELMEVKKQLYKEVLDALNKKAKEWKEIRFRNCDLKNDNIELLFEESVFCVLKDLYGKEEDSFVIIDQGNLVSIFDSWKGFIGYFTKFFETRRNFYKADGTSSSLITRIVDQNLDRFINNIRVFKLICSKVNLEEVTMWAKFDVKDCFSLDYYNKCILQDGIDKYNEIIGGKTLDNGEKLKGINECINKYRQDNKNDKIPFLRCLDKQICSEKISFIESIEDDADLVNMLKQFEKNSDQKINIVKNLFNDFVTHNEKYDLNQIYLSKEALNTIIYRWFVNVKDVEKDIYEEAKKNKLEVSFDKKEDSYKFPDFLPLNVIKASLLSFGVEGVWKDKYAVIVLGESNNWNAFLNIFKLEFDLNFTDENYGLNKWKIEFDKLIKNDNEKIGKNEKVIIKNYVDKILNIYQMSKYFALERKRMWLDDYALDDLFYSDIDHGYLLFYENAYDQIVKPYNLIRNYLTKKPFNTNKWKLNFDNPTLANGFDENKESDNSTVFLKKDGHYYIAIMKKGCNKIFSENNKVKYLADNLAGNYEKVVYKFFPDQAKMFPKVCFSKKGLETFKPEERILSIYQKDEFKKGDSFSIESMQKLIDFYKNALITYEGWKCYNFTHLKNTKEYINNIGEFFRDVAEDGYKISYQIVSADYINKKNETGELFLFEIHNQDCNLKDGKKKTGKHNLHTLYFNGVFSKEAINQNFPIKLNGQAELFFRPKTDEINLEKKKDKNERVVFDHKRYSEDKIYFHCPITLNRTAETSFGFNNELNNYLAGNKMVNVLGIDRGEKHLAYYSLIDQNGNVIESESLNVVNGIDYASLLANRASDRTTARRDWQDVENIKDLKKGYISHVVKKLADLAIKYNAIIVFEDLNMRFKQIRGGIEKSVYQQLEKALIDKLNYLVDKNTNDVNQPGGVFNAYQLTAPFDSFKDMGKQTGILFYTQASYTSKIDPVTGWRPNLYLKYTNATAAKAAILKFDDIKYNREKHRFEFTYKNGDKAWTLCSCVERYKWNSKSNNNKGGYEEYANGVITEKLSKLFTGVNLDVNQDLFTQIKALKTDGNESFFRNLIYYFNLICQIRNTDPNTNDKDKSDFILSPVEPFFDSRNPVLNGKKFPKNGDENGAYNIARKGLVILKKIDRFHKENGSCDNMKWGDLFISSEEWDKFAQK